MKTLCIAPFTKKEFLILDFLKNREINLKLLTPSGVLDEGNDISVINNSYKKNISVYNSIYDNIRQSDIVVISNVSKNNESLYSFALKVLEESINMKKEIICFLPLEKDKMHSYKNICKKEHIKNIFIWEEIEDFTVKESLDYTENKFYKFNVPVIYINELIPEVDGDDIFFKLSSRLADNNVKVLMITENIYSYLWGQIPLKLWKKDSAKKLIYSLNYQIYKMYKKLNPDLILVKTPKPTMKYNDNDTYDFGLTTYAISQAVPGDGCICCSYLGLPTREFWDNLNESCMFKFGYPILYVHISNQIIDNTDNEKLSTIYVPEIVAEKGIEDLNKKNKLNFYNLLNDNDFEIFYNSFYEDLFDFEIGVVER